MGQLLPLRDKQGWAVGCQVEGDGFSVFLSSQGLVPSSQRCSVAKSLEKAELDPAFISVGITEVSWQWECLTLLSAPTGLKFLMLDMCIYVTLAELTMFGSMGAL